MSMDVRTMKKESQELTERFYMRLSPEQKEKITQAAELVGMSYSNYTRFILSLTSKAVLNASQDEEGFNRKLNEELALVSRRLTHLFYAERVKDETEGT